MADVLTYSDFWFLSLIPIFMQSIALGYLWIIRKIIGKRSTLLLGVQNIALLGLYIGLTAAIVQAGGLRGVQPIESLGLFVDFAMPLIISTICMTHLRILKNALCPDCKP